MNVCNEKGVACDLATELGFCSVTGCMKQNRVSNAIIPTLTITDVPMVEYAPVVRCKDCKWFDEQEVCNKHFMMIMDTNFFCADGERKE